jgi:hypothetical protein
VIGKLGLSEITECRIFFETFIFANASRHTICRGQQQQSK